METTEKKSAPTSRTHSALNSRAQSALQSKISSRALSLNKNVKEAAQGIQELNLAHRGSYSIERLQAFDEYCRHASIPRVLAICLILPLPALVVAIGMECVPLQHPREGWRANYGAFIRDSLMFFMTCFGLCVQTKQLVPNLSMSLARMILVSAATSICSISLRMLIAEMWVYPIPFGYAWGATPYSMFVAMFFLLAVGRKQFREKPTLMGELWQQFIVVMVQVMLCVVYPAYNAVYLRLGPLQQTMFVFVLPLLKFVMQNIVVWSTKHIVEYMPGVTVFSVEVFNALYMAKCMQSAGSMATFAAIMAFDALESVLAYRDMKTRTAYLSQLMKQYNATNPDSRFVDTVMAVCQEPDVLSRKDSNIRIRSPIKLAVSRKTVILLDEMARSQSAALESADNNDENDVEHAKAGENENARLATSPGMVAPIVHSSDDDETRVLATRSASIKANTVEQERTSADKIPSSPLKRQSVKPAATDEPSEIRPQDINLDYPKQSNAESQIQEAASDDIDSPPQEACDAVSQIQEVANDSDGPTQVVQLLDSSVSAKECDEPLETGSSEMKTGDLDHARIESMVNGSELLQPTMMIDNLDLNNAELSRLASNFKPRDSKFASKISSGSLGLSSDEKVHFVNDSLKILFHCEYHALVEYVEAMIPMLYCIYVAILTQLPSRMYYPETRNMTTADVEKMVTNIFTYAWLEIISFIVMHYTIKWKFGFSPAYLLAFVLENQAMEFQARLLVWFTYVLEITLVHYGVDLTLKFAWLKGDWTGINQRFAPDVAPSASRAARNAFRPAVCVLSGSAFTQTRTCQSPVGSASEQRDAISSAMNPKTGAPPASHLRDLLATAV